MYFSRHYIYRLLPHTTENKTQSLRGSDIVARGETIAQPSKRQMTYLYKPPHSAMGSFTTYAMELIGAYGFVCDISLRGKEAFSRGDDIFALAYRVVNCYHKKAS